MSHYRFIDTTLDTLDAILSEFGIKYVFVESGDLAIADKRDEAGLDSDYCPKAKYWCELSWGAGEDDKYDFAYNDFGETLGEAIGFCLNAFQSDVRDGKKQQVDAAKDAGIYDKLIA